MNVDSLAAAASKNLRPCIFLLTARLRLCNLHGLEQRRDDMTDMRIKSALTGAAFGLFAITVAPTLAAMLIRWIGA